MRMRFSLLAPAALLAALSLSLPLRAQIIPPDAKVPVQVIKGTGEFAEKLNGIKFPSGKGWKPATDQEQRLQLMVPSGWKVDNFPDDDIILKAYPSGNDKDPKAILQVMLYAPRDDDPLEVTEKYATSYAGELAKDKQLSKLQFKPTDSGYVLIRGMKFALAGGTLVFRKKENYRQAQLVYVNEERIISIQFTAQDKDFDKYAADVAGVFASYMNLGVKVPAE
jgi:hypothetical protein